MLRQYAAHQKKVGFFSPCWFFVCYIHVDAFFSFCQSLSKTLDYVCVCILYVFVFGLKLYKLSSDKEFIWRRTTLTTLVTLSHSGVGKYLISKYI